MDFSDLRDETRKLRMPVVIAARRALTHLDGRALPATQRCPVTEKPSHLEDDYFAREEAEKLYKLHQEKLKLEDKTKAEEQKRLHWMKCAKCGYDLQTVRFRAVDIDKCFRCGVIVLDDGELEKLAGKEDAGQFVSSLLGLFKK